MGGWIVSFNASKIAEVPSDIDGLLEHLIIYPDPDSDIPAIQPWLSITIGEQEATAFFTFIDPGVPYPDTLVSGGQVYQSALRGSPAPY